MNLGTLTFLLVAVLILHFYEFFDLLVIEVLAESAFPVDYFQF